MNKVLNNTIGSPYDFGFPNLTADGERLILAQFFEQLLLFDKITITTNRTSFPLFFLINNLGINKVEELVDKGIIEFLIWSPLLFTGKGTDRDDGTRDESTIFGQPPIVAASLSPEDLDPENHIDKALEPFNFHRDRKRIFKRQLVDKYIIPDGLKNSAASAALVVNAYQSNNLVELGLPFEKSPDQLSMKERDILLDLGNTVLETTLLSQYKLKSYENFDHYKLCEQNLKNIGKAYKVADNTSDIFKIENVPDLKNLYLMSNFDFDDAMKLRYKSNAKYFRTWINNVSENQDSLAISKEYINEVKGNNTFFNNNTGKLLRTVSIFGLGAALGEAIAGTGGVIAGLPLGLLDTFLLDGILKGKNPSMFLKDIETTLKEKANGDN